MKNFKAEIQAESAVIKGAKAAITANRILLRDYSAAIGGIKAAVRQANRDGKGSVVSKLTRELNLRRAIVRNAHDAQVENRRVLRNGYIVRKALIAEWVAAEEA